jgi:hypothetical protein
MTDLWLRRQRLDNYVVLLAVKGAIPSRTVLSNAEYVVIKYNFTP